MKFSSRGGRWGSEDEVWDFPKVLEVMVSCPLLKGWQGLRCFDAQGKWGWKMRNDVRFLIPGILEKIKNNRKLRLTSWTKGTPPLFNPFLLQFLFIPIILVSKNHWLSTSLPAPVSSCPSVSLCIISSLTPSLPFTSFMCYFNNGSNSGQALRLSVILFLMQSFSRVSIRADAELLWTKMRQASSNLNATKRTEKRGETSFYSPFPGQLEVVEGLGKCSQTHSQRLDRTRRN